MRSILNRLALSLFVVVVASTTAFADDKPAAFDLVTAWEVLEHIAAPDLPPLFNNILSHLQPGGYLIASTTSTPDINEGVDLHQTKWTNAEWHRMIFSKYPELERADGARPGSV